MLTNPLCVGEVELDTATHQATFTWDSLHNVTQYETDNMVREIDNMAEVRRDKINIIMKEILLF